MKKYILFFTIGVVFFVFLRGGSLYCRSSERLRDYDTLLLKETESKEVDSEAYAHFIMAAMLDGQGRNKEAMDEYQKVLRYEDNSLVVHTRVAIDYLKCGRAEDAARHLNAAIKIDPDDSRARFILALLYTIKREYKKAAIEYEEIIKRSPGDLKALASLADLYVVQDKIKEAAGIYEMMLKETENLGPFRQSEAGALHFNLGIFYSKMDKYDEAVSHFDEAIKLKPEYIEAILSRAILRELKGDISKAIEDYKRVLEIEPLNTKVYSLLGKAYYRQNNIKEAVSTYKLLIDLEPDKSDGYIELADIYLEDKCPDAAIELMLKATALKDKSRLPSAYIVLGAAYSQKGMAREAIESYKGAVEAAPEDSNGYFYLAAAYEKEGHKDLAKENLKKAIELNPEHADALNYLGYMYAEEGVNLEEAERLVQKALEISPDTGAYIDSLGWIYFRNGMTDEAIKELERAISLYGKDPIIYDHLGDAYHKKGLLDKARQSWQKSLELNPDQDSVRKKLGQMEKARF